MSSTTFKTESNYLSEITFTLVLFMKLENNTDTDLVDTGRTCGGIDSTTFPNNQYGHGRLNTRKALEHVINHF